jgi:hypothetical protein
MSAGLAGPGGEDLPPSCLGHQRSKERRYLVEVVYRYDLWPLPDVPRPACGRTEQEVACPTCGRHVLYRVSSLAQVRRGRRLKWAAALALVAAAGGHLVAFVVLVRRNDVPLDDLVGLGGLVWVLGLPTALLLIGMLPWDDSVRLLRGGRHHMLRPPGATELVVGPHHDPYVM